MPTTADALFEQGLVFSQAGQFVEAIAAFSEAIELDPGYAQAYNSRGVARVELNDFSRALLDYDTAISLDPQLALAYYNRGNLYTLKEAPQNAITDYTKSIELNPQDADYYYNRGLAYIEIGSFDQAIADFSQVLNLAQPNPEATYNRGLAYARKGENAKAMEDLTQAINEGVQEADAYESRGLIYAKLNDKVNALADLRRALTLPSNHVYYIKAQIAELDGSNIPQVAPTPIPIPLAARRRRRSLEIIAFILSFALWRLSDSVPILFPLQLAVTFVHESGHGLAAILTGGHFIGFHIYANGAGVATTAGGVQQIILQMGYLGAGLFGAVLLVAANYAANTRGVARKVALFFAACTALFMDSRNGWEFAVFLLFASIFTAYIAISYRKTALNTKTNWRERRPLWITVYGYSLLSFLMAAACIAMLLNDRTLLPRMLTDPTTVVGLILAGIFFLLSCIGPDPINIFILNVLAFTVGFNALNDVLFLLQHQQASINGTSNDALAMAKLTNTSVNLWVIIWIVLVLVMMGGAILVGLVGRPTTTLPPKVAITK